VLERFEILPKSGFSPLGEVTGRLERVLEASVADETEIVWLERKHCWVTNGGQPKGFVEEPRLSVMVRVIEAQRMGWFRSETPELNEIEAGVRQALALAKVQPRLKENPVLPTSAESLRPDHKLRDRQLSRLDEGSAKDLIDGWCRDREKARLDWSEAHLVVLNSHGLRRRAVATETTLAVEVGQGPGAGRAAGSARSLEDLGAEAIFERARGRRAPGAGAEAPTGSVPVLLSPEATIELVNVLNAYAFSGRAYLDGTSFLSRHRNVQVFDRSFHLDDDGTREDGLPFPFDFEGSIKKPVGLIVDGKPSTPALTRHQGVMAGLEPTAQAVGGQESLFGNLFMHPGTATSEELLEAAAGGLFIGWIDPPECFDPSQLSLRTVARGVRRIDGDGQLGEAVGDLVWEDKLLRLLARLGGIGEQIAVRAMPSTPLGGISAPVVVLHEAEGFRRLKAGS